MIAVADALNQYMRVVSRISGLAAPELDDALNGRKKPAEDRRPTVAERFEALANHYPVTIPKEYVAALFLLVTWRNQFVHHDYRFGVALPVCKVLMGAAPDFAKDFQNTNIVGASHRVTLRGPPSLNDPAFLIGLPSRRCAA